MHETTKSRSLLYWPTFVFKETDKLSSLACRLVQWTGKYPVVLHPKHLLRQGKVWYLKYIKPTDLVLDIGCHQGQHSFAVARKARQVYAVDLSKKALAQAKLCARNENITNVFFRQHDANKKIPFCAKTFDTVLLLAVLEHLNNRQLILSEIKRVLKKHGYLFLSVPNNDTSWKRWQRWVGLNSFSDSDHKVEFNKRSLLSLIKKEGFTIVEVREVAFDMPFVGIIDCFGGISLTIYSFLTSLRRMMVFLFPKETASYEIVAHK